MVTRQGAGRASVSIKKDWGTPQKYVNAVRTFFDGSVDLDPCSNIYSIVGARVVFALPDTNGLKESWAYPTIYVTPPYGNDKQTGTRISDWLSRCCTAHEQHGSEVLALVPVATNTAHWKRYVFTKASGICFLYDTRLKFLEDGKATGKGAPMACAMVYWGDDMQRFMNVFGQFGSIVDIGPLIQNSSMEQRQN
jgi:DNA N-6-adenine-methyltransferase (Dam)